MEWQWNPPFGTFIFKSEELVNSTKGSLDLNHSLFLTLIKKMAFLRTAH